MIVSGISFSLPLETTDAVSKSASELLVTSRDAPSLLSGPENRMQISQKIM